VKSVQCPDIFVNDRFTKTATSPKVVFLAGGITGCPDWQSELVAMLTYSEFNPFVIRDASLKAANPARFERLITVNPRRLDFDYNDPKRGDAQVEWEFQQLRQSDAIAFWFPCETLCPISLYELGCAAASQRTMFVACHPDYERDFDVRKQLSLLRRDVLVGDSLNDLFFDIANWYRS
jgi:hypothetical protein